MSTVEKDRVASLPCPYIALIELIGFREQVAFRALRGRPICTPSCRELSRAQALTRHVGQVPRCAASQPCRKAKPFQSTPPGTCSSRPSSEAAPAGEQRSPSSTAGSRPTAALSPHRLQRQHLHGCGAFPPSRHRPLAFSPEHPLESTG